MAPVARGKDNKATNKNNPVTNDKGYSRILNNLSNMIGQANLSLYGTDRKSDVDSLNDTFYSLLKNQVDGLTNKESGDITSFLSNLVSNNNKSSAADELLNNQFLALSGDEYATMQSFIYDAYRNRLLEQADLHEVSSQLIELSEAILVTRDAIVSADVVEGRMSRSLKFDNIDDDVEEDAKTAIEKMENKFHLLDRLKNHIIPKTLEYGEYYAYVIPYSKLFSDFDASRNLSHSYTKKIFNESTLMESFNDTENHNNRELKDFLESAYKSYTIQETTKYKNSNFTESTISKDEFNKDLKNILSNITISNDAIPLNVMEEGLYTTEYMKEMFESKGNSINEAETKSDMFNTVANAKISPEKGIIFDDDKKKKKKKNEYEDITDCYIKLIEPTRVIPIKIMDTVIGYYYVQDEDITPLSGAVSSTLYYTKFNEHRKERTIVDAIADKVVKSFNKPFLEQNSKFKKLIVDCISYYNLNEKKLKFQFIPAEYMQVFKIDEDVDGNGTSMIKKSLFYAKLYLMLLLFKIMTILINSNDIKVNYIKQSGIDKNVANKVQEIARIRQSRQINITDLFSYTTLINKVGNGQEMYIPTGRSGERPIETEILSGQDVQLNSDLLEMLKNAYILGTGVPATIINYLQEADFAKQIEQNNTKYNGRIVNYQLDFNDSITEWYKMIMKYSTTVDQSAIENFKFVLQPPKSVAISTKGELINQFNTLSDFLVQLLYEDPSASMNAEEINKEIREFKKLLARDQLPMLDMDKIEELVNEAALNIKEKTLKPNPLNGDNGDDDGLNEELDNMEI